LALVFLCLYFDRQARGVFGQARLDSSFLVKCPVRLRMQGVVGGEG